MYASLRVQQRKNAAPGPLSSSAANTSVLRRGEEAPGDVHRVGHRPELLQVHPQLALPRHREQGQVPGVGKVEANPRALRRAGQGELSVRALPVRHGTRLHAGVAPQDLPLHSPARHERRAVLGEAEAGGPLALRGGQVPLHRGQRPGSQAEREGARRAPPPAAAPADPRGERGASAQKPCGAETARAAARAPPRARRAPGPGRRSRRNGRRGRSSCRNPAPACSRHASTCSRVTSTSRSPP
jgi:hypothetical protein